MRNCWRSSPRPIWSSSKDSSVTRHPKLEIYRAAEGKPLIYPEDDCIVAIAADAPLPRAQLPVLMLDDIEGIADVLQAEALPCDRIGTAGGEG